MRLAMLLIAAAGGAACSAKFPAAPAEGGPAWTELTSAHFTVWTDANPSRVYELIRTMERVRAVTTGVAYPSAPAGGRALAIVVRDNDELSEVSNTGESRAFTNMPSAPLWQPLVVLSLAGTQQRTLAHELTHLVSYSVIHHQPRWLAEGMATYFETMQLDADRTGVTLGDAARYQRRVPVVPIAELFDWGAVPLEVSDYPLYATAWALFSFLINEHRGELAHYLWLVDRIAEPADGFRQGDGARRAAQLRAWSESFSSLPPATGEADAALHEWLRHGHHQELWFPLAPQDAPITARLVSDADAHAIRALAFGGPTPLQEARERDEVAQALAIEPTNVLAWTLKTMRGERPSIALGRSIAAAHPDDWRAWWLATTALGDAPTDPALAQARIRACDLIAQNRALVAPPRLCTARSDPSPR